MGHQGHVKFVTDEQELSNYVSLLISILVRYPEIVTVRYDPRERTLKCIFMVKQTIEPEEFFDLKQLLSLSLETFAELAQRPIHTLKVSRFTYEDYTLVEVLRDVETLSQEELSVIIGYMAQQLGESLVTDPTDALQEDELQVQEEMIEYMLEDIRGEDSNRDLIGFRDEGRVLVFNKNMVPSETRS